VLRLFPRQARVNVAMCCYAQIMARRCDAIGQGASQRTLPALISWRSVRQFTQSNAKGSCPVDSSSELPAAATMLVAEHGRAASDAATWWVAVVVLRHFDAVRLAQPSRTRGSRSPLSPLARAIVSESVTGEVRHHLDSYVVIRTSET
jgi:hypothetical protein